MKLLKMKEVVEKTGCGKTKIYAMIKDGKFPRPCKIGNASRWREDHLDDWIKAQVQAQRKQKRV